MKNSGEIRWFLLVVYTALFLVSAMVILHLLIDVVWSIDRIFVSALFILVMPLLAVYFYMPHIGSLVVYALFAVTLWRYGGRIVRFQTYFLLLVLLWIMTGTFLFYDLLQAITD